MKRIQAPGARDVPRLRREKLRDFTLGSLVCTDVETLPPAQRDEIVGAWNRDLDRISNQVRCVTPETAKWISSRTAQDPSALINCSERDLARDIKDIHVVFRKESKTLGSIRIFGIRILSEDAGRVSVAASLSPHLSSAGAHLWGNTESFEWTDFILDLAGLFLEGAFPLESGKALVIQRVEFPLTAETHYLRADAKRNERPRDEQGTPIAERSGLKITRGLNEVGSHKLMLERA